MKNMISVMKRVTLTLIVLFAFSSKVYSQECFDDGSSKRRKVSSDSILEVAKSYYDRGEYELARRLLEPEDVKSRAGVGFILGEIYRKGLQVQADISKAESCYWAVIDKFNTSAYARDARLGLAHLYESSLKGKRGKERQDIMNRVREILNHEKNKAHAESAMFLFKFIKKYGTEAQKKASHKVLHKAAEDDTGVLFELSKEREAQWRDSSQRTKKAFDDATTGYLSVINEYMEEHGLEQDAKVPGDQLPDHVRISVKRYDKLARDGGKNWDSPLIVGANTRSPTALGGGGGSKPKKRYMTKIRK